METQVCVVGKPNTKNEELMQDLKVGVYNIHYSHVRIVYYSYYSWQISNAYSNKWDIYNYE